MYGLLFVDVALIRKPQHRWFRESAPGRFRSRNSRRGPRFAVDHISILDGVRLKFLESMVTQKDHLLRVISILFVV